MFKKSKKKILAVISCAVIASFMLISCGSSGDSTIGNPMKQVDNVEGFAKAKIDVLMSAPDGAKDVKYYTIDKKIAQINFSLDGVAYTYRGSELDEDISGVYEEFVGDPMKITTKGGGEIEIKTSTSDARLATWKHSDANYCLFAAKGAKGESMAVLTQQIAQQQEEKSAK